MLAGDNSKSWRLTQKESDFGIDIPESCAADDVYTFTRDGKFNFDEGATKCTDTSPQSIQGEWKFNAEKTEIIRDESGIEMTYKIISLNNDKLVLETTFIFTWKETYVKN